jgi:hypothetical protein
MIHINNFGWRLGNQLFQLAAAISLAEENQDKVAFPEWSYAQYFAGDFTPFKPNKFVPRTNVVRYLQHFHYVPIPYSRNLSIDGYFQSEKYFKESEKTIRRMFALKVETNDVKKDSVSIHVRRGDYLEHPQHHPVQPVSYYHEALSKIKEQKNITSIYVFSDDIEWCQANLKFDLETTYVIPTQDIYDFGMMSKCDNHIICNSTFSWWSAWLNPNKEKIVVAPKLWFGPAYSHWNTSDVYCPNWIVI